MPNRRARRAQSKRSNHLAEGIATLAVLAALGKTLSDSDDEPVQLSAEGAHLEGVRLAARLFTASSDEQRDERLLEAVERTDAPAAVLAHGLRQLSGGYLQPLVARINELERNETNPTELDMRQQAFDLIASIDHPEEEPVTTL